jgi:hypothetical protein
MGANLSDLVEKDYAETKLNTPVTIDIRKNDNNKNALISKIEQPLNGSVIDNQDGTVTYTPNKGFNGNDAFAYGIHNELTYDFTMVNITVTENNINKNKPFPFLGTVYAYNGHKFIKYTN